MCLLVSLLLDGTSASKVSQYGRVCGNSPHLSLLLLNFSPSPNCQISILVACEEYNGRAFSKEEQYGGEGWGEPNQTLSEVVFLKKRKELANRCK